MCFEKRLESNLESNRDVRPQGLALFGEPPGTIYIAQPFERHRVGTLLGKALRYYFSACTLVLALAPLFAVHKTIESGSPHPLSCQSPNSNYHFYACAFLMHGNGGASGEWGPECPCPSVFAAGAQRGTL